MSKFLLILVSAFLLGGCVLQNLVPAGGQSTTASPEATTTPAPDTALEAVPSPATGTDDASLETDLNNTVILNEDFSDLE